MWIKNKDATLKVVAMRHLFMSSSLYEAIHMEKFRSRNQTNDIESNNGCQLDFGPTLKSQVQFKI